MTCCFLSKHSHQLERLTLPLQQTCLQYLMLKEMIPSWVTLYVEYMICLIVATNFTWWIIPIHMTCKCFSLDGLNKYYAGLVSSLVYSYHIPTPHLSKVVSAYSLPPKLFSVSFAACLRLHPVHCIISLWGVLCLLKCAFYSLCHIICWVTCASAEQCGIDLTLVVGCYMHHNWWCEGQLQSKV